MFSNKLNTVYYNVKIKNLPNNLEGLKVVQISDLHNSEYGDNQHILTEKIQNEKPDLIFITGDIIDREINKRKKGYKNVEDFLREIPKIAKTYFVTGNHEFEKEYYNKIIKEITKNNIIILEDNFEIIKIKNSEICITGLDDERRIRLYPEKKKIEEAIEEIETKNKFTGIKILLCHKPHLIKMFKKYNFDIIFSGHAHGGQVRIPKLINGLYAPGQGIFPKYAGGVYCINDKTTLVVTRGLAKVLPRVWNRPEIVVVTLNNL